MSEANKFDPRRRLCPDGGCIGVIGDDGRCRVCGRAASGNAAAPAGFEPAAQADDDDDLDDGDNLDVGHADADADANAAAQAGGAPGMAASPARAGAFDPNRRLCPDGSCLGVLGADGVCNVCGQKAE